MKYQTYPAYKDSGVEWLGDVPEHWTNAPIKYMALEECSLFLDGDWIESKDLSDEGIRYITTGNIGEGIYKEQGAGYITEDKFETLNCTEVFEGDILISRLNLPIGRSCIVPNLESRIITSVDNVIFRPDSRYSKNYLVYLFSSEGYFKHTGNVARGTTMQRISRGLLGNIRVIVPTLSEQQKIAQFLDHETAKIDTLIEKQQRLIELLKEKRQAVISHAVTKGLNPSLPMKDSGVAWLGEVPEGWIVAKVKFFAKMQGGYAFNSDDFKEDGIQLLRIGNVYLNRLELERQPVFVDENFVKSHKDFVVRFGDLLMSLTGTLGKTDYGYAVRVDIEKEFMLNQRVAKITPNETKITNDYLFYSVRSEPYLRRLYSLPSGTKQANLSNDDVLNISIFVPPSINEQNKITSYICENLNKYDDLIEKCLVAIELIQERRTALISAAVTGKIDVRDWGD